MHRGSLGRAPAHWLTTPVRLVLAVLAVLAVLVAGSQAAFAATTVDLVRSRGVSAPVACSPTLQSLVDAAAPDAIVELPACIYRETVTISHPIVLRGTIGTELRGSDIWTTWRATTQGWLSGPTLPTFAQTGECRPFSDRCHQPEQVFVDGIALERVGANPRAGQFNLSADRHVILGQDPAGHLVEVSTRDRWIQVSASGTTVRGITFRHAANGAQAEDAALRVSGGSDRFQLDESHLFEAHGTLLGIVGGRGHLVLDSELARAGQQGFGFAGTSDTEMRRTSIHDNNLDLFDPTWEAGAGKASRVRGLVLDGNLVDRNAGPGLWCDIDCQDVSFIGNRVYESEGPGIFFEISSGASIEGNVVTESGWGNTSSGWGGGILISSSGSVEVTRNTLAWNADGISVISQARGDRPADAGTLITLEDNTVLAAPQEPIADEAYLVAWIQDWSGPLYSPESRNSGRADRYWSTQPESSAHRFHWTAGLTTLASFSETPGGEGGRYLTVEEKDDVVAGLRLEPTAEVHAATQPIISPRRILVALLVGLGAIALVALLAFRMIRRRRSRRGSTDPGQ